jgi:hypothetical protein
VNSKLRELLEKDELNWDDPRHREVYLKYWVNKPLVVQEEDPDDE